MLFSPILRNFFQMRKKTVLKRRLEALSRARLVRWEPILADQSHALIGFERDHGEYLAKIFFARDFFVCKTFLGRTAAEEFCFGEEIDGAGPAIFFRGSVPLLLRRRRECQHSIHDRENGFSPPGQKKNFGVVQ